MPKKISLSGGREIEYIYDAAGVKLAKITYGGKSGTTRTDYAGSYVYKDNTLDYQIFSEGRKIFNNGTWQYEYHLKDHLGNVRVAFDETGQSLQENHYYPFGLRIADLGLQNSENKYLYNGKEMQDDFGLDWLDYGARFYDAEIGRFHTVDRYAEKYYSYTPYHYAANNPIKFIDVNGDSIDISNLSEKQIKRYSSQIELLSESKMFAAYYKALSESETVYTISAQKGEEGTPSEAGQFFNPKTNEVGLGEEMNVYVVAQELFHAYQSDGAFYKDDKPNPLSTIETEGDIATIYVMTEAGLAFPNYGDWSLDFQFDAFDGIPNNEKIQSATYQKMFQDAVDKRIEYCKASGINAPTYTSPNRGIKPKALEEVVKRIGN